MASEPYDVGDLVRCTGTFTNTSDVNIDPDDVFAEIKTPSGVESTYEYGINAELVKDATGEYHIDVDANAPGRWHYRFFSTGTGQAASEGSFTVRTSAFA